VHGCRPWVRDSRPDGIKMTESKSSGASASECWPCTALVSQCYRAGWQWCHWLCHHYLHLSKRLNTKSIYAKQILIYFSAAFGTILGNLSLVTQKNIIIIIYIIKQKLLCKNKIYLIWNKVKKILYIYHVWLKIYIMYLVTWLHFLSVGLFCNATERKEGFLCMSPNLASAQRKKYF
jgi:hypothetical protein